MATGEQTESWSEEYIDCQCSICETNKKTKNADHYCSDCQKYLCSSCLSVHNTFSDKHNILTVTADTFQKVVTEKCEKHPYEVIKYYCRSHDVLLCNTCGVLDHKKCDDLKHISESAEELSADQNLQEVPRRLQYVLGHVNRVIKELDEYVIKVNEKWSIYLEELEDYAHKLLAKIKELQAIGHSNITNAQQKMISTASESRNACNKVKEGISKCIEDMKRSEKRPAQIFVLQKKGQEIIQAANNTCWESEHMIKDNVFCFRPETQIADTLNSFASLVTQVKLYKSKLACSITLKIPKDKKECDIQGCCRLGDGSLVVADHSNKRLKRVVPSTNKVTDHFNMIRNPFGVCCIGSQEVAVADGSNIIHIVSAVKGLTLIRTIDLSHATMYIACHGREILAGCSDWLSVYDMTGRMLRQVKLDDDDMESFGFISGIAIDKKRKQVFVTDLKSLVCVSRDGRRLFRNFTEENLGVSPAWGVTIDNRGSVMFAGQCSNDVLQVTEEGRVVGDILSLKDGITSPQCLCYDDDMRRLYVGGASSQLLGFDLM